MKARKISSIAVVAAILFISAQTAMADLYLTTAGSEVTNNGAWFVQIDPTATGTGNIDSFVRIQATGTEEGYNTDYRPVFYNENTSPEFTHTLFLSVVPTVTDPYGHTGDYREFMLDINQTNANPLLSLDAIDIYLSNDAYLNDNPAAWTSGTGGDYSGEVKGGVPVWSLNDTIQLDYSLNAGSGSGDMFAYIPESNFGGGYQYVYLYSHFGTSNASNDGFEEWAVQKTGQPVPVPGAVLLGMLGLSVVGVKLRKFA